jgi:hypothetical protein
MMRKQTSKSQNAGSFAGFLLLAFGLLAGVLIWQSGTASGPALTAAGAAGLPAAPLDFIDLNRNPAPPNCVQPGGTESFNWTIQFSSVPDHYVYSITDPHNIPVYGPFTVNVQGRPSPVTGSDSWPVPANAMAGNYGISIDYYSNFGLESTASVIFIVCGPPTLTPTAVPPTLTVTPVPPTLTPTAVPPTLTTTPIRPTLTPTVTPTPLRPTVTPTATPTRKLQGCSAGFWKAHPQAYPAPYTPNTSLGSVFILPACGGVISLASATFAQALEFGGGPSLRDAAQVLMREGVAAVLNATAGIGYPLSEAQVISEVNNALASCDRATILSEVARLNTFNNRFCPLH